MIKTFEVKEFDSIISNPAYKDDENYKYLEKKYFDNLIKFIYEFSATVDNEDVLKFMHIKYKRNLGEIISIRNYVGLIQLNNGFQIQVLPKITLKDTDEANSKATKKIFIKMLRSMKNFPSKVFNDASLKVDKMNLYELFINMYLQEVRSLVKKGLKAAYLTKLDNLKYYKGKLIVDKDMRYNLVHKERFYVSYEDYNVNRPENKLIKATMLKLQKLTTSFENSKEIRQLLASFEMVEQSFNYAKDFSKVIIDRNTKEYEIVIKWSKVFLMNKSFSTFSGSTISRALLFPMESIFESYVFQELKKVMSPAGWHVSKQDRGKYLFIRPKQQFALRPDIVMTKKDRIIVLDTKWKNLVNNEPKNYGIAQSDMYQMYTYSKKYKTSEVWLLYPINSEMFNQFPIHFDSGDGAQINVHFVNLADIEKNLTELRKKLSKLSCDN